LKTKSIHPAIVTKPLLFAALIGLAVAAQAAAREPVPSGYMEVQIERVLRDPRTGQPVVILTDERGERGMPIWIGESEAQALEAARQEVSTVRPLTHDLIASILKTLQVRMVHIKVTALRDNIYYGRILLERAGRQFDVDSRPSDAMVLAVKVGCPILIDASLFETQSVALEQSGLSRYGLELQELTNDLKAALEFRGEGLLVSQVEAGSQAEKDGLERVDILTKIGGHPVRQAKDLEEALAAAKDRLSATVYRSGRTVELTLHPQ
jgi:bifunctional DNase/RNase